MIPDSRGRKGERPATNFSPHKRNNKLVQSRGSEGSGGFIVMKEIKKMVVYYEGFYR